MGMLHGTMRALLGGAKKSYIDKVLGTDPFAYWPQNEKSGLTAIDLINSPAQDGTYTGVTLNALPGPDGQPTPFFDGANDFNNVFSATLQGALNGSEGTLQVWSKVANAGVWTDGTLRRALTVSVDANNEIFVERSSVDNALRYRYEAGGVAETGDVAFGPVSDWFSIALTWSIMADTVALYLNGVPVAVKGALGAWAGAPVTVLVGARTVAPSRPWHGNLAHPALWTRPLAPAEIADLAVV